MPETDVGSSVASDFTNAITDFSVTARLTDGAGDQKEHTYQNTDWSEDYGYYLKIPEFKTAVDAKATWTVGAGFTADEMTELLLMGISGNGKDSFNSILKNMIKVKTISKDSFAEIIRDKNDLLVNLKPLSPDSILIVQNRKGRIKRYELISKTKTPNNKYAPTKYSI